MIVFHKEMTFGEIFRILPGAEIVMRKYFHGGCHHCPSQNSEPLWLAAKLYGLDVEEILKELCELEKNPGAVNAAMETATLSARERRLKREQETAER